MPYINSAIMPEDSRTREWWYNSLDCAVTHEIYGRLAEDEGDRNIDTYRFMLNQQGQALDAMLRGFLVDEIWRRKLDRVFQQRLDRLVWVLNQCAFAVVGHILNPNSPPQLKTFFYEELNLPVQYKFEKGVKKVSTDREALEKLQQYSIAKPFCILMLAMRDLIKKLSVLRQGVGADSRMRCTFHVAGTETGRWSSSKSVWGDGTNLQNITEEMRRPFQADPGKVLIYVDGEQAESRGVGFIQGILFGDWTYLDACEAGDLHTTVCQLVWPSGVIVNGKLEQWFEDKKANRELAEQKFYRWFSYRDMAKRGGHGTNYYGKPPTMAKHLKVPVKLIADFQEAYFKAFPAFSKWHNYCAFQLQTTGSLRTFLGRERIFFGRPDDEATLREAIAFEPQSIVGDIVNEGGYRLWKRFPQYQPLVQVHDAWLGQIPHNELGSLVKPILDTFEIPITDHKSGRTLIIPAEAKVGFNWQSFDQENNPDGLKKWKGSDERVRQEFANENLLDRIIY